MAELRRLQQEFAAAIRDPQAAVPEGVEERRMAVYRDLFYRNVESFLANAFPVLRHIDSDPAWHARVRRFFLQHRCREPQFYKLAEEFLRFLEDGGLLPHDPPFLLDLCHYEWVELALSLSEAEPAPRQELDADTPLQLSPLAWPLCYDWPVHRIGPGYSGPQPAVPTHLVVYRNVQDAVRFVELNPVSARFLQLLESQPGSSARTLVHRLAGEMQHPQPQQVLDAGLLLLGELSERGIVQGP